MTLLLALFPTLATAVSIRLTTTTTLPGTSVAEAHAFLATPQNWPSFVLSSVSVKSKTDDVSRPFAPGMVVDEVFGLPPILPLEVKWTCVTSDPDSGSLAFSAPEGLKGVASDCMMEFDIRTGSDEEGTTVVDLAISYEAISPLARAAIPLLNLDNGIALRLGLPAALSKPPAAPASPLGTTDPIAGPLVAASRRIGLLPEAEEDGWTGEPSAWAEADSVPQRLSALSQRYLGGVKQRIAEVVAGEFDVAQADAKIDEAIASPSGVAFFSFTNCPFCKQAKALLDAKGARYALVELDEEELGAGMRARLGARSGRTSVPSIWIGGECIGGLNDGMPGLVPLDEERVGADGEESELDRRLRAVGAVC